MLLSWLMNRLLSLLDEISSCCVVDKKRIRLTQLPLIRPSKQA